MKLTDMPNSDTRHFYWKCSNKEDHMFTTILYTGDPGEKEYLESLFAHVEKSEHQLPAWRLLRVTEDREPIGF